MFDTEITHMAILRMTEPITSLKTTPEAAKVNEEVLITGEGLFSAKTTVVRFMRDDKKVGQVTGKFVKEKNGVTFKMPVIEVTDEPKPVDIPLKVSVSFNDGSDWSEADALIKFVV
jgi:hypothetical protein